MDEKEVKSDIVGPYFYTSEEDSRVDFGDKYLRCVLIASLL